MSNGPGRPPVAAERSRAIVDAYINLLAEQPTVQVSMAAVAERAGVARTAVAHFVGDRTDLQRAAVAEVAQRYEAMLGEPSTADGFIDAIFSPEWHQGEEIAARAFDAIQLAAATDSAVADSVRALYEMYVNRLTDAISQSCRVEAGIARPVAYAIVCLSEHHGAMAALGIDAGRPDATREAALALLEPLR